MISFQNCSGKKKDIKNSSQKDENSKGSELIIFHSNTLNNPIEEVIIEFNKLYPDIKVSSEAATIIQTVKKVTEQKRLCDIIIVSDYNVLDRFVLPNFADWSVAFAGNEIVIAYNDKSKRKDEINPNNWYKILLDKNVKYGRADKDSDVCGRRTILMIKLAENFYKQNGLAEHFANKDKQIIVPKVGGLIPLLQSNSIDYIFTFKSFAVMHNLKYISLPAEINFSSLDHLFDYGKVSLEKKRKINGKTHEIPGSPILYSMTIPRGAPNPSNALLFADFLLNPEKGLAIFAKMGNNIKTPIPTPYFAKIPASLKKYVVNFVPKGNVPLTPDRGPVPQPPNLVSQHPK